MMIRNVLSCLPLAALLALSPLAAQQASFTTFGAACTVSGSTPPAIDHRGLPQLGATFQVTYSGPNSIQPGIQLTEHPMLVIGFQRLDLPVPQLLVTQPAGCTLHPTPDMVVPTPVDPRGQAYVPAIDLRVPNDPALRGGVLYMQWMTPRSQCTFVGCGLLWAVFSDAARVVVGT